MGKIVCWFSGGITSTVATKLALERYEDVEIIFFETGSHHPDNDRYFAECEKWFGQPIIVLRDENHEDIYSIFNEKRFINSPYGAPCTQILKRKVRQRWEDEVEQQVVKQIKKPSQIKKRDIEDALTDRSWAN